MSAARRASDLASSSLCCLYQTPACSLVTKPRLYVLLAVCVVEPVFIAKQIRQFAIKPKQGIVPTERGRDFGGYLVMVNRFLGIALGFIYRAENTVEFADLRLFAFLRKEIDRAGCGLFCSVKLFVRKQEPSEADQTLCLARRVTEPSEDLRCLLRLFHPFFVEAD